MSDTILSKRLQGAELVIETSAGTRVYDGKFLVAALLVYVARGSGSIEPEESARMIELIRQKYRMPVAESLELLTQVVEDLADLADLGPALADLGATLSEADKEDIALMALKVIAADGRREASEMEHLNNAVEALGILPETVHRAFDRYFAESGSDRIA